MNMLVWLDETGTDKRDQYRKYGYSLRGIRPNYHRQLCRGTRINAIACMSLEGLVALELIQGSDTFVDFVRGSLIPHMQPFPNPYSVVVMDDCSIHHTTEVAEVFQQVGIPVVYLPPYSPDLMPLEESFSSVKNYLRRHMHVLLQAVPDPTDIIQEASRVCLSKENCHAWIAHAGSVYVKHSHSRCHNNYILCYYVFNMTI